MVEIIKFNCTNGGASICGWMALEDYDCEAPLNFYNAEGFEIGANYPQNPFPEFYDGIRVKNYEDFEELKEGMQTDELLIQFLVDFARESKSINRGTYKLHINGGSE